MFTIRSPIILTVILLLLQAPGLSAQPGLEMPGIITSSTSVGTVDFPHSMHAADLEIECVTCHHETNATALRMPHPEYFEDFWIDCQTCHRAGASPTSPQACSACHHSSHTAIADETLSAKVVIHQSCFGCHEGGTGQDAARSCGFCHHARASDVEKEVMKPAGDLNG